MSRLGDLENTLVSRLASAMLGDSPLFEVVRGVSGGFRASIRDAMKRERIPAAYVAFIEEPTAPETSEVKLGAKFVVYVAARALRVESDPRHGDANTPGAFVLLEKAREQLDDYEPSTGLRAVNLHEKFVEADNRIAVYELLYRIWPIVESPLTFAGQALTGSASRMTLHLGPLEMEDEEDTLEGGDKNYLLTLGLLPQTFVWQGQLRAASDSELNTIESNIEAAIAAHTKGNIADGTGRVFTDCILERVTHNGPRRPTGSGAMRIQNIELHFVQLKQAAAN